MKSRIKTIYICVMLTTALLLGGCSEEVGANDKIDVSTLAEDILYNSYPESVKDGTVSVEYYFQLKEFYSGFSKFNSLITQMIVAETENDQLINQASHRSNFRELLNDYNALLSDVSSVLPSTDSDKDIDAIYVKVIPKQKEFNDSMLTYIDTKDFSIVEKAGKTTEAWAPLLEELNYLVGEKYHLFK